MEQNDISTCNNIYHIYRTLYIHCPGSFNDLYKKVDYIDYDIRMYQ